MRNIDVLLVFEHRNRELDSVTRLSELLNARGITTDIKQVGWDEIIARFTIRPKVIVVPWCYDNYDLNVWREYRGQINDSINIHNLHCEQVAYNDAIEFCMPKDNSIFTYHSAWGEYYYYSLINYGVEKSLIINTGSPRMDFLKKKFCLKTKSDFGAKYLLDKEKKWILLVGNFAQMGFTNEKIEELESRGITTVRDSVELSRKSFLKITEWINNLLENDSFKDIEFIYRPHPSEKSNSIINQLEKDYNNFHVISKEPIKEWYTNCDLAFVWSSTSSVEASCAGTPVVSLRPYEIPDNLKIELVEMLDHIENFKDFEKLIYDFMNNVRIETNPNFLKKISFYYGDVENDACIILANELERETKDFSKSFKSKRNKSISTYMKLFNYYIKVLFRETGLMKKIKKWEIINREFVSKEEKDKMIELYRKIDGNC